MTETTAERTRWARDGALFQTGMAFVAGALLTLGHPPVGLPWSAFVALPLLAFLLARAPHLRRAALLGWAAGFGYFTTGLHWVGHAFLIDAEQFALLMPLGVLGLPAFLGLFWSMAAASAWRFAPRSPAGRAIGLAVALSLVEILRTHVLTGFPWALPGYIWVDTPVMQVVSVIGPHGLTLATLLVATVPVLVATGRRVWRPLSLVGPVVLTGLCWIWGAERLVTAPDEDLETAPVVRVVQPNAPQESKWDPAAARSHYARALALTEGSKSDRLPDIIVWPEAAVTFLPAYEPERVAEIADAAAGATVLFGAFHAERTNFGDRWMNALHVLTPDGRLTDRYDKHHLVPFGEYLPFAGVLERIGLRQFALRGGFATGPGPRTLTVPGAPAVAAAICYEMIFPHAVVPDGVRPGWIVQITNDAWFGTFAGPQQHYAQARIRAIEQGLPVVRAANTGISAIVDAYGRERTAIPLDRAGRVDHPLPPALAPTIYARNGDLPAYLAVFLIAAVLVILRQSRQQKPHALT